MAEKSFSPEAYIDLLKSARLGGYAFADFLADKPRTGNLYLRHDVDYDPGPALQMAEIENELGVTAHYFFLVGSPVYSISEKYTFDIINQIYELKHKVGVHFDERLCAYDTDDLAKSIEMSIDHFQALFSFVRPMVSFHNPTGEALANAVKGSFFSTYHPDYFPPNMKYISDSNRNFREGDPKASLARAKWDCLQLLIHPIWWFFPELTAVEILKNIIEQRKNKIDKYAKYSSDIYI
jgi:hypothetical protein